MANKQKTLMPPPKIQVPIIDDDDDEMNLSEDEEGGTRVGGIYIPPPIKPYCSQESKGPRLVIWSIDNTMFKSYAKTVTVGPFHHRFSAVIGPNGSGKSNVIDSMLFVFGYKAQKIRSKRLSVLIHNSSKYENVASCRVAVHFRQIKDNPDGTYEIIPDSDIVVARTAYRDNKSFYTINNKEVNFKEVAILLQHHGIDLMHNRFLILQGEVESIAMMKPKAGTPNECGLLEYLEDIVGTTRYKKPLLLINDRLDRLNEERSEKHNRCRLAEREMKDLEIPMTEAVEYLKLENKLCTTQNLHMQVYVFVKKRELVDLNEKKDKATAKLTEHDEKYLDLKKQRVEKEKGIQEEIKKHEALNAKREEFKTMQAKAKDGHTRVQAKMKATNNRRKELKKQQEVDKKSLEELQTLPERNNKEIAESEKQISKMTKEKVEHENVLTKNLAKLEVDTKPLREEKEPLEKELGEIRATLDELKANYSVAEKELDIIRMDETTEARKFETLKNSFEDTKRDYNEKNENLEELKSSIPSMQKELVEKQEEIKVLQSKENLAAAELSKIRTKIDDSTNKMQTAKSNSRVLNVLMKQKQTGKIPGILGRLGDLGGIDPKYDVAISTCCGRLDNIVVEDVSTAQMCIQFLKTNGLGHATFIALDKMDRYRHNASQKINTPENVPRLYDLIHVEDERVRPALYFALFDTLVAGDLDQANRIAYGAKRFRVVSLNGDLIEMTGTMSGGGRQQKRGGMGSKVQTQSAPSRASVSEVDLEALNVACEQIQSSINDLQHRQGILEEEIRVLIKSIQQKDHEIKRLIQTVKSYAEQLPRIEDQLKKQQQKANSTKSDSVKVKTLEAKVKDCKFEFENKQAEVDVIQDKVNVLNKRIKEISDKNIKEMRVKIDKLSKQIEKLTKNISTLTVEIRTTDRNMQKANERIANSTAEIEEAETNLRLMDTERTQFSTDEEELEKRVQEVMEEIANATTDSSTTKKEILAIQKQENDGKIIRLELDENVKAIEKNFKEETAKIPHWERKLKSLKLQPIPNEQMPNPPFKTYTDEELETRNPNELQYEITKLEEKLSVSKPNLSVIDDYNKKREAYLARVKILEEVTLKRNEMGEAFDGVRKKRYTEFTEGFQIISRKLKEMYQMITLGGDAELELVDSMDPFSEGIVFSVRPPKKSWKHISNLSGGEKTLSSLALVFALHYYKPSPLYFMDEIDAALDFKNVSIVANYINERTKNAQFIIISLRSNMFELADHLAGIYKVDDCSHSMTIKNLDKKNYRSFQENQTFVNDDEISPEKTILEKSSADPFDQVLHSSIKERSMEVDVVPKEVEEAEEISMDIDSIPEEDEAVDKDDSLRDSDDSGGEDMEISGAFIPETPNSATISKTLSPE